MHRIDLPPGNSAARVVLRRLRSSDLAAFQAYRQDPQVQRYQGWQPMADAQALAILAEMSTAALLVPGEWCQIGIAAPANDDLIGGLLIGDIGVCVALDEQQAEVGITLSPASQGRGLATAALREAVRWIFHSTPVLQIIGTVDARNTASIRLLPRVGMRQREVRNTLLRGESCVDIQFAIARREWAVFDDQQRQRQSTC